MFFNDYLICLRFTRGSTIKRTVHVRRSVSGRVQSGGLSPRTFQLGGETLDGKICFPLMTKGDRFIRCKSHRHGSRGSDGHRGSMSDMNSILHGMNSVLHQSISINVKGGDFLLIGLVVIDVNP
jgi:hypothetical protein